MLLKYPVRIALNPLISTIGWVLPATVGGEIIVSKVLNLDTTGPILLEAILNEDMFLAGGIIFLLSVLTVIGTLLSDILLVFFKVSDVLRTSNKGLCNKPYFRGRLRRPRYLDYRLCHL